MPFDLILIELVYEFLHFTGGSHFNTGESEPEDSILNYVVTVSKYIYLKKPVSRRLWNINFTPKLDNCVQK